MYGFTIENNIDNLEEDYSDTITKFKGKCKKGICYCFITLTLFSSYALIFYIVHTYDKTNCNSTIIIESEL